ncbi:MAG: ShlB/FhaC/HecB family hemolysin secretion/activation protein [Pseudomonadota bacterium]
MPSRTCSAGFRLKIPRRNRWLAASLRYLAEFEGGSATVLASVAQGLDDPGARADRWAFPSRSGVPDDYRFVRLDLDVREEVLPELNARLRMAAQYAFDPLPSVVRPNVGGDPFGRAFDNSMAVGDSGVAATFELSRALPWSAPGISGLQAFVFVDYAALWSQEVGVDYADARLGAASAGLRAKLGDALNAQLLIAIPWEDSAAFSTTGSVCSSRWQGSFDANAFRDAGVTTCRSLTDLPPDVAAPFAGDHIAGDRCHGQAHLVCWPGSTEARRRHFAELRSVAAAGADRPPDAWGNPAGRRHPARPGRDGEGAGGSAGGD